MVDFFWRGGADERMYKTIEFWSSLRQKSTAACYNSRSAVASFLIAALQISQKIVRNGVLHWNDFSRNIVSLQIDKCKATLRPCPKWRIPWIERWKWRPSWYINDFVFKSSGQVPRATSHSKRDSNQNHGDDIHLVQGESEQSRDRLLWAVHRRGTRVPRAGHQAHGEATETMDGVQSNSPSLRLLCWFVFAVFLARGVRYTEAPWVELFLESTQVPITFAHMYNSLWVQPDELPKS